MMGNAATLGFWHFSRSDIQALVKLQRITVDNFTANFERQPNPQIAFPGAGRTNHN